MIDKKLLPQGLEESQIICLMKFGSHLYGTDTESSDTDYKGVYMPTKEQIFMNRIPKSFSLPKHKKAEGEKNTSDDIDLEIYSLHYFLELAMKGETIAIDMLHAEPRTIEHSTEIWIKIWANKYMFYCTDMRAMVSYSRKQAAKYGIKGSRLNDCERVIDFLEVFKHTITGEARKLREVWEDLPEGEHIHKFNEVLDSAPSMYQVCGKKFQDTVRIPYVLDVLKKFYESYGHRAKLAAENKGIDWKAVSHAMRFAYQMYCIFTKGGFTFPLTVAPYLKQVKAGELDWVDVQNDLESMIDKVEQAAETSKLPKEVDRKYWEEWLYEWVHRSVCEDCNIKYCYERLK
jgi:hypothetical protein